MDNELLTEESTNFDALLGIDLSSLLEPISKDEPTGKYLRSNGVYSAIKEARRHDADISQGIWQHDLKHSEWNKVSSIAIEAIGSKSKDLQIAIWLLEAKIHQSGFSAIAPCVLLICKLCERYWEQLHPQMLEDDIDYRINPILWANEKLLPTLRQVPLTQQSQDAINYHWADWEIAQRNDQTKTQRKTDNNEISVDMFIKAVNHTPTDFYQQTYTHIQQSLSAFGKLSDLLDTLCGDHSPSLSSLTSLLEDIAASIEFFMQQRGVILTNTSQVLSSNAEESNSTTPALEQTDNNSKSSNGGNGGSSGGNHNDDINNRQQAYAQLAEAADYLMKIEPHSPAPYLVRKAIEWGNLSTPELYQELFVQYQGQLNIFEVLGLKLDQNN